MNHIQVKNQLKKHLFITHTEKFSHQHDRSTIERYVAKHPALKPQIIMLGNQPHGFKEIPAHARRFEDFPIYAEMDFSMEDGQEFIEQLSIYTEFNIEDKLTLEEIKQVVEPYKGAISIEYIQRFDDDKVKKSVIIHSKLFDRLVDDNLVLNDDDDDLLYGLDSEVIIEVHISCLLKCIEKISAINKIKRISTLEELLKQS